MKLFEAPLVTLIRTTGCVNALTEAGGKLVLRFVLVQPSVNRQMPVPTAGTSFVFRVQKCNGRATPVTTCLLGARLTQLDNCKARRHFGIKFIGGMFTHKVALLLSLPCPCEHCVVVRSGTLILNGSPDRPVQHQGHIPLLFKIVYKHLPNGQALSFAWAIPSYKCCKEVKSITNHSLRQQHPSQVWQI